ncbi:putative N-acetyltransferase YjaB [Corynebacterium atrinae]|uniref:acetyltransferase n=1 Tax=Corynebacterium atrinae TaxID=1336740 RepID=UPI0025B34B9E|nr:acetyltransferase [Corynebacterium atrinae]WJY64275.1 putative N-acetyltransferase YjaB [Corynebacterium atrinae]
MPVVKIRPTIGAAEYPELVKVWRSSVDASHDFLSEQDRDAIEDKLASDYFPAVDLWVAEHEGCPIGFSGVADGNLEMLFIAAEERGTGAGSALLAHAVQELGVLSVDVNEQNELAAAFYLNPGFEVTGRSDTDEAGRPYPLLHLRISTPTRLS